MLELQNIQAGYGSKMILNDISASFDRGKITCILGPNGSGKSTLLRAILRDRVLQQGTIWMDGIDVSKMKSSDFAQKIAYLPQGRAIPEMTVEQLVLHGRYPYLQYSRVYTEQDQAIAVQAMQRMQIDSYAQIRLSKLSGGMRQSAYIAMVLAQNTDYILLDEPNVYLDIDKQQQVMKILRGLAQEGKGIIVVMHDLLMTLEAADRILLLENGRAVIEDTPEVLYTGGYLERTMKVRCKRTLDGHYYYA